MNLNFNLDSITRKTKKEEYEKSKEKLEGLVKTLNKVLEDDDAFMIIAFNTAFKNAFAEKEKKR